MSKDTLPTSAETFEGLCVECCCKREAEAIDAHVRAVVREMLAENAPAEKPEEPACREMIGRFFTKVKNVCQLISVIVRNRLPW